MLNRSPRQVPYSGGGPGVWPGQYAPHDDSTAFAAVWKANRKVPKSGTFGCCGRLWGRWQARSGLATAQMVSRAAGVGQGCAPQHRSSGCRQGSPRISCRFRRPQCTSPSPQNRCDVHQTVRSIGMNAQLLYASSQACTADAVSCKTHRTGIQHTAHRTSRQERHTSPLPSCAASWPAYRRTGSHPLACRECQAPHGRCTQVDQHVTETMWNTDLEHATLENDQH